MEHMDYWVEGTVTLDSVNNYTKRVRRYPLANSTEDAKNKFTEHCKERFGDSVSINIECAMPFEN